MNISRRMRWTWLHWPHLSEAGCSRLSSQQLSKLGTGRIMPCQAATMRPAQTFSPFLTSGIRRAYSLFCIVTSDLSGAFVRLSPSAMKGPCWGTDSICATTTQIIIASSLCRGHTSSQVRVDYVVLCGSGRHGNTYAILPFSLVVNNSSCELSNMSRADDF